jgi:p-hydroxybenzoate 3-monooxygenase
VQRFTEDGPFERALQVVEFDHLASSTAAQTSIFENYIGLPV